MHRRKLSTLGMTVGVRLPLGVPDGVLHYRLFDAAQRHFRDCRRVKMALRLIVIASQHSTAHILSC